jgi:hypothetical protein
MLFIVIVNMDSLTNVHMERFYENPEASKTGRSSWSWCGGEDSGE